MSKPIISVRGIGKRYKLGERVAHHSLRDALSSGLSGLIHRAPSASHAEDEKQIWAVRDASFDVEEGDVVGIVGRNGAGKSTLLKILAQITEPTMGEVRIRGRVASLLEVGTGFHPDLSGRENIFLNGAILGMTRREIKANFDAIVDFASLSRFIDTPVKRYSSGMYVRLAFAVAAHLEPEILLVDEILAVGDAQFQRRCLGRMEKLASEGRTVLFVSHNMGAVGHLCKSGVVMDEGRVVFQGASLDAIRHYMRIDLHLSERVFRAPPDPAKGVQILEARIVDEEGRDAFQFDIHDSIRIALVYRVAEPTRGANLMLMVSREGMEIFCSFDTDSRPELLEQRAAGEHRCMIELPRHLLKAGMYSVSLGTGLLNHVGYEHLRDILTFDVDELTEDTTSRGYSRNRNGVIIAPVKWS